MKRVLRDEIRELSLRWKFPERDPPRFHEMWRRGNYLTKSDEKFSTDTQPQHDFAARGKPRSRTMLKLEVCPAAFFLLAVVYLLATSETPDPTERAQTLGPPPTAPLKVPVSEGIVTASR